MFCGYLRVVHCGEHVMKEMVAEGGVDQRLGQGAVLLLWLVHVARGVQGVQTPVSIMSQLVASMIQLRAMVGGGLSLVRILEPVFWLVNSPSE